MPRIDTASSRHASVRVWTRLTRTLGASECIVLVHQRPAHRAPCRLVFAALPRRRVAAGLSQAGGSVSRHAWLEAASGVERPVSTAMRDTLSNNHSSYSMSKAGGQGPWLWHMNALLPAGLGRQLVMFSLESGYLIMLVSRIWDQSILLNICTEFGVSLPQRLPI